MLREKTSEVETRSPKPEKLCSKRSGGRYKHWRAQDHEIDWTQLLGSKMKSLEVNKS